MKLNLKSAAAGVATLAIAGSFLALGGGVANAATLPPWESPAEANEIGTLTFYNAAGDVVTSGSTSSGPVAAYVVGSHAGRAGDALATLQAFTPTPGVNPALWGGESLSASTDYPVTDPAAPAVVRSTSLPVVTGQAAEFPLDGYVGDFPQTSSTAGYVNTYQLRLQTSGPGQSAGAEYDAADIVISGHTWTQVFPVTKVATTVAAVSPSVASPAAHGSSVTLTSTLSAGDASHPAGAVELFDGLADVGPATLTAGTGAISKTITPADGSHSYTLVFTPTDTGAYNGATSPALSYTVNGVVPVTPTTTNLAVNTGTNKAGAPVILTATVSPSTAAGTVTFSDSAQGNLGTTAAGSGTFTLTTSLLNQGDHTITATLVPTDSTVFGGSSAVGTAFTLAAADIPADPQAITVNVLAGTITITTPWTPANPFTLGDMVLASDGTSLQVSRAFGDSTTPANGVTITDTRAGDQSWTASASATDFKKGTDLINGQNLGLTNVTPNYITGNALNAITKPVVGLNVPADTTIHGPADSGSAGLKNGPHQIASAVHGVGTVYVDGTLTLNAPTSTPSGLYTATLTFTIA
jgi:hypothetical protein